MTQEIRTELSRDLRLFDITMIGVGAMIGAGIFVLTGIAAGAAGPALILSFALNGIITVFTAMVYAELGSAIPEAGGGYLWVKEGLPGPNAFQAGWMSWFAHSVAGSLYALGFGSYLALVLSELDITLFGLEGPLLHKGLAVGIILIFVAINFKGVSETGAAGNVITVLKIVILLVFIGSGLWAIYQNPVYLQKFQNFTPNGMGGVLSAMGLTFIAFEGYEIIVQAGEEVQDPRRNIPRAIFLSLAIVVPIYMLVAFVAIGAVNPDTQTPTYLWLAEHAELGVAEAARQFMPFGTILLLVGGLLSTMSALNATLFSSTRVSFAMGRDRNLPDAFAAVNSLTRTPHKALMFTSVLVIFMAIAIPIHDVAAAADIMFLLLFLQVNIAVITIRKKYGDRLRYGYLMPFFPIVPIIGILTKLFLAVYMFNYSPIAWYFALAWLAMGLVIYYVYVRGRMQEQVETPVVLEERSVVEGVANHREAILVPIANPASLDTLLTPAIAAARHRDAKIVLLHVVTVPEQLPLSAGRDYIPAAKSLTSQALERVIGADVPVQVIVRISHHPADAIIQTALQLPAKLLILGWQGRTSGVNRQIGSNIDRIIEEVNCDVMMIQQAGSVPIQRILVPLASPLQTQPALQMAQLIATGEQSRFHVVHLAGADTPEARLSHLRQTFQHQIDELVAQAPDLAHRISLSVTPVKNVDLGLASLAQSCDYVVMGATRESWLRQQIFGSKLAHLAESSIAPIMLVRPQASQLGFGIRRIFNYVRGGYRVIDPSSEKGLSEQGILLPKTQRHTAELHTSVNKSEVVLAGGVSIIAAGLMYWGAGNLWTWAGAGLFFVALGWFTWQSLHGTVAESTSSSE